MKLVATLVFLTGFSFLNCTNGNTFKDLPNDFVHHHLIVLGNTNNSIQLKGLKGATPARSNIELIIDERSYRTTSDGEGRFSIEVGGINETHTTAMVHITHGSDISKTRYSIKNLSQALGLTVASPFATDREIDAIDFVHDSAFILSSQAGLVREFKTNTTWQLAKTPKQSMLLNPAVSLGARSITTAGAYLAVPFFNTHEVAVVLRHDFTLKNKSRLKDSNNNLTLFPVRPPAQVLIPINADEQHESNTITSTAARNAEVIGAVDDDHFLVGYANYFQFAEPNPNIESVVGPGILGLMRVSNDTIQTKASLMLPCKNPTQLLKLDDTTFLVQCSGGYIFKDGKLLSEGAGVAKISIASDFSAISTAQFLDLAGFAPSPMAVIDQTLVIPKAFGHEVLVVDHSSTSFDDSNIKSPHFHRSLHFTFAKHWHDDIVFLGDNQGSLVAFSVRDGFFPFPFIEPITFLKDADKKLALGAHQIYFRHQAEKYDLTNTHKKGFDAWALTTVHRLIPLDFMQVFGP